MAATGGDVMMHPPRIARSVPKGKRTPILLRSATHLAFIRTLPCLACGRSPPSEAAHVRNGTDGGMGIKPGDRYCVPLCVVCHALQHRMGELSFWAAHRIDPLDAAAALWTNSGDTEKGERIAFRARQGIELHRVAEGRDA